MWSLNERFIVHQSLSIAECETDQPLMNKTIGDLLTETALECPDTIAVISHHENISKTYRQLNDDATKLANFLRVKLKLSLGDSVAIWCGSCYNLVVTMYACSRAGLLSWLMNPKMAASEVQCIASLANPKVLFLLDIDSDQSGHFSSFTERFKNVQELSCSKLITMNRSGCKSDRHCDCLNVECILQTDTDNRMTFDGHPKPQDPVCVWFTSGSTGVSKALVRNHFSVLNDSNNYCSRGDFRFGDKVCLPVPLYYGVGNSSLHACAISRSSLVLPGYRYSASDMVQSIESHRCSYLVAVPTMLVDMLTCGQPDRLVSLRSFLAAGAPVSQGTLDHIFQFLPDIQSYTIEYGSSEIVTNMVTSAGPCTTVGQPLPGVTVKILDEKGNMVPHGIPGRVYAKGPVTMTGYHRGGDVIDSSAFDRDGWYDSGDICRMDTQGFLYYLNRAKDIVNRGGVKVAPTELEDLLNSVSSVRMAIVVGVPDPRLGQEICAFVQVHEGQVATAEQLTSALRDHLSIDKLPRHWLISHALPPLLGNGKLDKVQLKKLMEQEFSRQGNVDGVE